MPDSFQTYDCTVLERAANSDGSYTAVLAVNDHVGGYHDDIQLREVKVENYLRNPVVLYGHDHYTAPGAIGRTTTIDIDRITGRITARFEFLPGDERARRVKNAWDRGFLRAASISVNHNLELREWSIVPVGADIDAVRSINNLFERKPRNDMSTAADLKAEKERAEKAEADLKAAQERAEKAEAEVERMKKEHADDDEEMMDGKKSKRLLDFEAEVKAAKERGDKLEADLKALSDERATEKDETQREDVLRTVGDLLPEDFSTDDKSVRDILLAAAGDEIENAANRTDDYLLAKLEDIAERRENASARTYSGNSKKTSGGGNVRGTGFMSHTQIRRLAQEKPSARA